MQGIISRQRTRMEALAGIEVAANPSSSLFLSEVGESALQKTTYSDGGARRKDFDADPSPSLFLSEVGESSGQGWVDKRQVTG